ncbi:glycogen debranching N-terminal domain-containing protein [Modestobacter sp. KNN46-3]|uniref:glycogen debranching N-terminal domain-containing protein n=1 Tax=Modestobacter sp. KNN46-3 TaxID=2711218 RepID=UPI0013DEE309|nr:glycogen debranching N-terminal domain-containing protein [Modestobacter sp. KNN46-3]
MELRTRPHQRFAYRDRSLLVTSPLGLCTGEGAEGFYFHNTRMLSRLSWSIDGQQVTPFAWSDVSHAALLGYAEVPESQELQETEVFSEVTGAHLELSAFVGDGLRLRAEIANYTHQDRHLVLGLHLAADFSGTAEADAGTPDPTGPALASWDPERRRLELRLDSDQLDRAVRVQVLDETDAGWNDGRLTIPLSVPARGRRRIEVAVCPVVDGREHRPGAGAFTVGSTAALVSRRLGEEPPLLEASDATVQRTWDTAVADLASLPLGLEEGPNALIAGVPLYDQFFGRDTLTTGWQALLALRSPLRDALRVNAALQGERIDDWRDEEPGAMIHQAGDAPASARGDNPFDRYYGDYATPVDYVAMLGQYYAWTGDRDTALQLLPAARRALTWLDRYGDLDRDGLLEYRRRSPKGVRNQGWKDAPNAIVDAEGQVQSDPLITCELQGYWYSALRNIVPVLVAAGDRLYARRLLAQAARLRQRINDRLWLEDAGIYALGLDSDGRPLTPVTSNAGHMLLTGVATPEQGQRVAARLMQPDMFSGWGIRTLSTDNPAYNPFSYHLGSVWAVEQGTIAAGFGRYGCWEQLHGLARGLFDTAELFTANRIPEAVGGLTRDDDHPHPGVYPQANAPQSWSASGTVLMIQALLGVRPVAPAHLLLLDPRLPDWLPELNLRRLRIGDATVDLHVWRHGDRTKWRAQVRTGRLLVRQRPSLRTPQARTARAVESLVSR